MSFSFLHLGTLKEKDLLFRDDEEGFGRLFCFFVLA